jgi:hypothetical protein
MCRPAGRRPISTGSSAESILVEGRGRALVGMLGAAENLSTWGGSFRPEGF